MEPTRSRTRSALALAALLSLAGVTHFARPKFYDAIVPRSLPGTPRQWTYVSGAAELAVAAAVATPRTRRLGAFAAVALFVAVFPANVKMALDFRDKSPKARAIAYGRLPLQIPLVAWAWKVAKASP
ncbi:MauE/DoxX family redox-associated membrane protein [Lentzea sp. NBRC 102530]|uniref:DoxX family protein n=1 Tax=Lentzea sp. NBRC 102530 TaxID=3032201 RepID=UPI0024A31E1C|nr:MauE/DoxX family redox-associated membrane protein [Lentzea sp. NBRC 102530]GLY54684.1 membrane protein [Lentzea sp. NBRC 102530]